LIKDENLKFLTKVQGGHPDIKRWDRWKMWKSLLAFLTLSRFIVNAITGYRIFKTLTLFSSNRFEQVSSVSHISEQVKLFI
jgi:hypothetical protein